MDNFDVRLEIFWENQSEHENGLTDVKQCQELFRNILINSEFVSSDVCRDAYVEFIKFIKSINKLDAKLNENEIGQFYDILIDFVQSKYF